MALAACGSIWTPPRCRSLRKPAGSWQPVGPLGAARRLWEPVPAFRMPWERLGAFNKEPPEFSVSLSAFQKPRGALCAVDLPRLHSGSGPAAKTPSLRTTSPVATRTGSVCHHAMFFQSSRQEAGGLSRATTTPHVVAQNAGKQILPTTTPGLRPTSRHRSSGHPADTKQSLQVQTSPHGQAVGDIGPGGDSGSSGSLQQLVQPPQRECRNLLEAPVWLGWGSARGWVWHPLALAR